MTTTELYTEYTTKMQKIADVKYASAVLQWDQETYMPLKGDECRGRQIATLSEIAHQQFADEKTGNLLTELNEKNDLTIYEKRNVALSLDDYTRNKKLSSDFVRKMSEAVNKAYHAWVKAREQNMFSIFEQPLHTLIELKKEEADLIGYKKHPYDALMNDYDKGLTVEIVDTIFANLQPQLLDLLTIIKNKAAIDNSFLHQHFDKQKQWDFGIKILQNMDFDFEAGRQDISLHPFTTNFSNSDVRVTTRIDEKDLGNMIWSCIHECGHALYEQGLPSQQYGLPLGEYCSLSIHESQSRIWENCIGRSFEFWQHHLPILKTFFKNELKDISTEQFYKGINKVQPSLIRTEADELTYHFHVMIRFEIEKMLIDGSIKTKDIPAYWNEHYKKYLGITVPDDKRGCLQDIHWSHGSFGYFATYSLGSMYAAQMYATIERQYLSTPTDISKGNHANIFSWLQKNVYATGRFYSSEDLCKHITGETLQSKYFINYAQKKYAAIYE